MSCIRLTGTKLHRISKFPTATLLECVTPDSAHRWMARILPSELPEGGAKRKVQKEMPRVMRKYHSPRFTPDLSRNWNHRTTGLIQVHLWSTSTVARGFKTAKALSTCQISFNFPQWWHLPAYNTLMCLRISTMEFLLTWEMEWCHRDMECLAQLLDPLALLHTRNLLPHRISASIVG